MQTATQYSPEQLLEAGRRAEAQGQVPYAVQFYRYLAEQYPQSSEGFEARDALYRLAPPAEPRPQLPQAPQQPAPPAPPPQSRRVVGDLRAVRPEQDPHHRAPEPQTRRREPEPEPELDEETPRRGYRIGRFVAAMLNAIGWLMLLSVVVMIPVVVAALTVRAFPRGLKELITGNVLLFAGGTFGALVLGLFAVFAAQVARAAFDTADGVRWLAMHQQDRR